MRLPSGRTARIVTAVVFVLTLGATRETPLGAVTWLTKVDPLLQAQGTFFGRSRVILRATTPQAVSSVTAAVGLLGGQILRPLPSVDGLTIDLPNVAIPALASNPLVARLSYDRVTAGAMERTGATIGATAVRSALGYDGTGIGVAVIDSGITSWHDDLTMGGGGQRVDRFVDFTASATQPYDDFGHGTHVAGIIAGNGYDSSGARTGIAPGVRLTVLKVLDGQGKGRVSDVIAAFDYVIAHRDELHIRIVNLSVASGVYESYLSDPLTLAARKAVDAGIVVVAAAGNYGRGQNGSTQYGGITAPGNAPWVLTVGASSHMGTTDRADDTMAAFSSRGPTAVDYSAKPDLVAPGVGIESLSDPASRLYTTYAAALLNGTVSTGYAPYLSLSGSSMSTPVVSGTVALMLQANPSLAPNAVKALLQYTAQTYSGYDVLTQGAGFLNAKGAVELAAYFASPLAHPYPDDSSWSHHLVWGNRLVDGAAPSNLSTWGVGLVWGDPSIPGVTSLPNVVWGALCGGADCAIPWNSHEVTTTSDDEGDIVVWGTSDDEGDIVVWGTSCSDPSCEPFVWGHQ